MLWTQDSQEGKHLFLRLPIFFVQLPSRKMCQVKISSTSTDPFPILSPTLRHKLFKWASPNYLICLSLLPLFFIIDSVHACYMKSISSLEKGSHLPEKCLTKPALSSPYQGKGAYGNRAGVGTGVVVEGKGWVVWGLWNTVGSLKVIKAFRETWVLLSPQPKTLGQFSWL